VSWSKFDGDTISNGELFCEMRGKAHSILRAERVVLNFMQRMSGIATLTKQMADQAISKPHTLDRRSFNTTHNP
jgi:nicotinate-nucleotide pyrophosphorylase (carboxylating)